MFRSMLVQGRVKSPAKGPFSEHYRPKSPLRCVTEIVVGSLEGPPPTKTRLQLRFLPEIPPLLNLHLPRQLFSSAKDTVSLNLFLFRDRSCLD